MLGRINHFNFQVYTSILIKSPMSYKVSTVRCVKLQEGDMNIL